MAKHQLIVPVIRPLTSQNIIITINNMLSLEMENHHLTIREIADEDVYKRQEINKSKRVKFELYYNNISIASLPY